MKTSILLLLILSISLYPQVTQDWAQRYTGPGWLHHSASDIEIDAFGNVYVTGGSHGGLETYVDYATIKYNSDGVEQWVARYNTPINTSSDAAVGLVLDNIGNVYVTGTIWNGENYDFATVKYNSSGIEQWVRTYNGPGNGHEYAVAIVIDGFANIYVIGSSNGNQGIGSQNDYATIKYDSDGNELWVSRYDGPPGVNAILGDDPSCIIVDELNNVYVTGRSENNGSMSSHGYATVKYNSSGVEQWVRRYDYDPDSFGSEATSIEIDNERNIYVTGKSYDMNSGYDYATIKYNNDGVEQWVKRYIGPDSDWSSEAVEVKVDNLENVYVTGTTSGQYDASATVKYNSSGAEQWVSLFEESYAVSMAIDAYANIYVTGVGADYVTVKYNSAGIKKWEILYDGPDGGEDHVTDIEVSEFGDVYVTGYSWGERPGTDPGFDYATIKYSQSQVSTSMTMDAPAGSQALEVASTNGFSIGDNIVINPGGTTEETNTITGFGSIFLQTPLQFDHFAGEQILIQISTSVESNFEIIADEYSLSQNYPNPFNPSTTISWQSPVGSHQTLKVYDLLGNEVATLVDEFLPIGSYKVNFSAKGGSASGGDASGLSSGIYFYKLQAGSFVETKKMLMIK